MHQNITIYIYIYIYFNLHTVHQYIFYIHKYSLLYTVLYIRPGHLCQARNNVHTLRHASPRTSSDRYIQHTVHFSKHLVCCESMKSHVSYFYNCLSDCKCEGCKKEIFSLNFQTCSNPGIEWSFSLLSLLLSDRRLCMGHDTMTDLMVIKRNDKVWSPNERKQILTCAVEIYLEKKCKVQLASVETENPVLKKRQLVQRKTIPSTSCIQMTHQVLPTQMGFNQRVRLMIH